MLAEVGRVLQVCILLATVSTKLQLKFFLALSAWPKFWLRREIG